MNRQLNILRINDLTLLLSFFLFLLCISCGRNLEDIEHLNTREISKGLFIEHFWDNSGGAHASTKSYFYLTDSLNFRKFLVHVDDDEGVYIDTFSNGVFVNTYYSRADDRIKDSSYYDIEELRQTGEFDE